ncbi:hypothetical protein [Malaciobacter marinus]|uniref:hypothetical protein n=1 Tax=Malaciobacter marinus TaxID=505249 RepID=UPI003AFF7D47
MNNDLIPVINTNDIKKLIKEMTVVNTLILSNFTNQKMPDGKVKEGLISQLKNTQESINRQILKIKFYLSKAEGIENKLKSQQTEVEENEDAIDEAHQERLKELEAIKSTFEKTNEVVKDFNEKIDKKIEIFESSLDLRTDEIHNKVLDEIKTFKKELTDALKNEINDINNSIVDDKDIQKLISLNTSITQGLKNLKSFNQESKKLKRENLALYSGISFLGGGFIFSLFIWLRS